MPGEISQKQRAHLRTTLTRVDGDVDVLLQPTVCRLLFAAFCAIVEGQEDLASWHARFAAREVRESK